MDLSPIILKVTVEGARALAESLDWSMQATERSIAKQGLTPRLSEKWEALDDLLAQLQTVKRDRWYGREVAEQEVA